MAKVFINPGHSMLNDAGAINPDLKLEEREVVLRIGKDLQRVLQSFGIETVLYQEKKSLNEVPKEANKFKADVFVSIHMNAPTKTASGVEVFHCEGSLKGKEFANTVLNHILQVGDYKFKNRGVKDDANRHLGVLRYTNMTSILIEMGFITNDKEASFVSNNTLKCAQNIAVGIIEYLKKINLYQTITTPVNQVKNKISIIPSNVDNRFNLIINNKEILLSNKLETIYNYLQLKYKSDIC